MKENAIVINSSIRTKQKTETYYFLSAILIISYIWADKNQYMSPTEDTASSW